MGPLRELSPTTVHAYSGVLPTAIAARCGWCNKDEFFWVSQWSTNGPIRNSSAACPVCRQPIFFSIHPFTDSAQKLGGGRIYMAPGPSEWMLLPELEEGLRVNPEILRDYKAGIAAFNSRDAQGTVSAARRLLEGLVTQFIPKTERRGPLAPSLERLHEFHDLGPMLHQMSVAVKDAGNLGVHYGASRLSHEIAVSCWRLVDDLLRLHFVLENRVTELQAKVNEAHAARLPDVADSQQPSRVPDQGSDENTSQ